MKSRFRAPVARGLIHLDAAGAATSPVDRERGIIHGASAMQAVEALGHGVDIDEKTLTLVRDLGNAAPHGVKVRFAHPGLCADGMGTLLGRQRNFRIVGDKVGGDVHLNASSAISPDGNHRDYVLTLAEEDPTAFGMSVVVESRRSWKLADGSEIDTEDDSLKRRDADGYLYFAKPATAVGDRPYLRPFALHASDMVDEPAANRAGLFAELAKGTTSLAAAEAFESLDALIEQVGWSFDQARAFIGRYFDSRTTRTPATTPKDQPMRVSLAVFTALLLANEAFAKDLSAFAADPKNADADEKALNDHLVSLKLAAADKSIAGLRDELAAERKGRAADKLAADKALEEIRTKLAAETRRADGLAGIKSGCESGNKVVGDHSATELSGLSGEALYRAEFDRSVDLQRNFGNNFKAYALHRKEQDEQKPKG